MKICAKCGATHNEALAIGIGRDAGTTMRCNGGETRELRTGKDLGLSRGSEYCCKDNWAQAKVTRKDPETGKPICQFCDAPRKRAGPTRKNQGQLL